MKRVALVTGGTGLLGSWLVRLLASHGYQKIYVLARGSSGCSPKTRVYQALGSTRNGTLPRQAYRKKVEVLDGDICQPRLGLSLRTASHLLKRITDIFHTAATADFNLPLRTIRIPNVTGTRHVCELALLGHRIGSASLRMHHISTIGVAGTSKGWFGEEQFDCSQDFHNSYEQSKFEAESLAREYIQKGLNVTIYRPAIITGDSQFGITTNFKMFYQPLHFLSIGLFEEFPANEKSMHSLVPVDKAAEAIYLLSQIDKPLNDVWHIVNPSEISVGQFVQVASNVFGFQKPTLIPLERFSKKRLSPLQWNLIRPFVPYFNYRVRFRTEQTDPMLRGLGFRWPKIDETMLTKLFRYCISCGFIRGPVR